MKIVFNEGVEEEYEVSDLAGKGVFEKWNEDENLFKVFINKNSGAVSWPGDIEIDTLNTYCTIKGILSENIFITK